MRHALAPLALAALLAACAPAQPLTARRPAADVAADDAGDLAALNRDLVGQRVTVHFTDGSWAAAAALHVGPAEASWADVASGAVFETTTARIDRIVFPQRGSGLVGTVLGTALGLGVGAAFVSSVPDTSPGAHSADLPLLAGGAVTGAVAGAVVGPRVRTRTVRLRHPER